jgi:hypothetical protein
MKQLRFAAVVSGLLLLCSLTHPAAAQTTAPAAPNGDGFITLHNDFYQTDDTGARILTRSGCLCQFDGVFYWYGATRAASVNSIATPPPI